MRALLVLFFTGRLLLRSVLVYSLTRLLPAVYRTAIRRKVTIKAARQTAAFFTARGGVFIKASQFLATISNLLDSEFSEVFSAVPDVSKPAPPGAVRARIEKELGCSAEEAFLEFDYNALATASLGQVHKAVIPDGRTVAVKILYPKIESSVRSDLWSLRVAVRWIRFFYPHLDFHTHLHEFSTMLFAEIDYVSEAENIRRCRNNFSDDERIIVPDVIPGHSGSSVLTTEFIYGVHIHDTQTLKENGVNLRELTELFLETYAVMVFKHRFYHADPHPGNFIVVPAGPLYPLRIALIDFGAVQNVSQPMIDHLESFFSAFRRRDIEGFFDLATDAGLLTEDADREAYITLFEIIEARYGSFKIDDYYRINPVRFGRMVKMQDLRAAGLRLREPLSQVRLPRKFIYPARTLALVISLSMRLDSEVNIFRLAKPHIDRYISGRANLRSIIRSTDWHALLRSIQKSTEYRVKPDIQNNRKTNSPQKNHLVHYTHSNALATGVVTAAFTASASYFTATDHPAGMWLWTVTAVLTLRLLFSRH